jgi:hypothetical protein
MMKQAMGHDYSDRSISELIDAVEYWVFPNWLPWAGIANALQYRFRPNGNDPESCIFDVRMMYPIPPGEPGPPAAKVHQLAPDEPWTNATELGGFGPIMEQDEANLKAIQRGRRHTRDRPYWHSVQRRPGTTTQALPPTSRQLSERRNALGRSGRAESPGQRRNTR